jgi:hypothetical protein
MVPPISPPAAPCRASSNVDNVFKDRYRKWEGSVIPISIDVESIIGWSEIPGTRPVLQPSEISGAKSGHPTLNRGPQHHIPTTFPADWLGTK